MSRFQKSAADRAYCCSPPKLAKSVPEEVVLRIESIHSSIVSSVQNLVGLANLIPMERAAKHGGGPVHNFRQKMLDYCELIF